MDREIILSLLYACRGSVNPAMERYLTESPETAAAWGRLDAMINQSSISCEAFDLAAEYGALREADGFLSGFRLAVRLLMSGLERKSVPVEHEETP